MAYWHRAPDARDRRSAENSEAWAKAMLVSALSFSATLRRLRQIPDHRRNAVATEHGQGGEAAEVRELLRQPREELTNDVPNQRFLGSDVALEAISQEDTLAQFGIVAVQELDLGELPGAQQVANHT